MAMPERVSAKTFEEAHLQRNLTWLAFAPRELILCGKSAVFRSLKLPPHRLVSWFLDKRHYKQKKEARTASKLVHRWPSIYVGAALWTSGTERAAEFSPRGPHCGSASLAQIWTADSAVNISLGSPAPRRSLSTISRIALFEALAQVPSRCRAHGRPVWSLLATLALKETSSHHQRAQSLLHQRWNGKTG